KSSLALKVLQSYESRGFFTLLIHSPSGYEPRDFLLSIFQRLCEATIRRLEEKFEQELSLEKISREERRRLNISRNSLIATLLVALFMGGYYFVTDHRKKDYGKQLEAIDQKISYLIADINAYISQLKLMMIQLNEIGKNDVRSIQSIMMLRKRLDEASLPGDVAKTLLSKINPPLDEIASLTTEKERIVKIQNEFRTYPIIFIVFSVVFYGSMFLFTIFFIRIQRKIKLI